MRRMLHRCNSAVTRSPDGRPSYAPSIALELERQLDVWYDYLPANIRFAKVPDQQLCADRSGSLSVSSMFSITAVNYRFSGLPSTRLYKIMLQAPSFWITASGLSIPMCSFCRGSRLRWTIA